MITNSAIRGEIVIDNEINNIIAQTISSMLAKSKNARKIIPLIRR
jgi:hypothetical protein